MIHYFHNDTAVRFSAESERNVAALLAWQSNRRERTLFPFLLALALIFIAWAAGLI